VEGVEECVGEACIRINPIATLEKQQLRYEHGRKPGI
jgi:hypothetical protein